MEMHEEFHIVAFFLCYGMKKCIECTHSLNLAREQILISAKVTSVLDLF